MAVQLCEVNTNTNHLPQRIERKFYVIPKNVSFAYGLLRHICHFDSEYPSEQINSLYFDTADLDQHERSSSGDFRKNKVRIRWYGKENNLDDDSLTREQLIQVMVDNPILIERPIVIKGKKAAIGRPPEKVLDIL